MKKSTSIIIAFILAFFISSSINAQTVAIDSKKSTEKECVDKQEKECTKTNKGFRDFWTYRLTFIKDKKKILDQDY